MKPCCNRLIALERAYIHVVILAVLPGRALLVTFGLDAGSMARIDHGKPGRGFTGAY
jgi:hypothetical protein